MKLLLLYNLNIALDSLLDNKLKSILTALGVIFGVSAVISMLAIGRGAKQEILDQMKLVGVNNIVISPVTELKKSEEDKEGKEDVEEKTIANNKQKRKYSPGLTMLDVEAIRDNIPTVVYVSPEIIVKGYAIQNGIREKAKITGISSEYLNIYNLKLECGTIFNRHQEENGLPVCIITPSIKTRFFKKNNPIGQYIKFGTIWLKIIGVIEYNTVLFNSRINTGVDNYNNIFIPVKTMILRFQNRGIINSHRLNTSMSSFNFLAGAINMNTIQYNISNYHQLDKIIIHVNSSSIMQPTAEVINRLLLRRHVEVKDFEVRLPLLELKQEQRSKDIFNIVLGTIAGISLLVGGIGIMNIMFASVMERIKEIGIRMAIGAKKSDIRFQFLSEAVLISTSGGIIGIVLGIFLAEAINKMFDILTIVTPYSVIVAFGVSTSIGILFGYYPSKRASEKNPIESIHYE